MKNPFNFLLTEKLRQQHLAAELKRSKALTSAATRPEAKTPLFDAVAAASKATGKSGDEVLADHFSGASHFPAIDAALEHHKPTKPAVPAIVKPPVAITKPSPAKPITQTHMTTTPSPSPAPTATAASFATAPLTMTRAEFNKLSPADKSRFSKQGGKLI